MKSDQHSQAAGRTGKRHRRDRANQTPAQAKLRSSIKSVKSTVAYDARLSGSDSGTDPDATLLLDMTQDLTQVLSAEPPAISDELSVVSGTARRSTPETRAPSRRDRRGYWPVLLTLSGLMLALLAGVVVLRYVAPGTGSLPEWLAIEQYLSPGQQAIVPQIEYWIQPLLVSGAAMFALLALRDFLSGARVRRKHRSRAGSARHSQTNADHRLASALEGLPDACLVLNQDRQVTAHNSNVVELLREQRDVQGVDAEALYQELCPDSTMSREALAEFLDNLHADATSSIELLDHRNRHLLIRERPTASGEITTIIRDVSDARNAARKLREATDYDALTSLPNRALFMRELRGFTQSLNNTVALVVCDIRNFRQINDSYGQDIGDQVLVAVSGILIERMPDEAVVARVAGDEFGVMIHPVNDRDLIEDSIRGFLDQLRSGIEIGRQIIPVAASIGVAYAPEHGTSPMALKNAADSACAQAKTSVNGIGAHVFSVFDPELQAQADRMHRVDAALHQSINRGELQLEYQPQVDIATNLTVGMEALLRWESASLGRVSPAEFIPLAERSNFILTLGDWVLKHAIEDYKQLAMFGTSPGALSINLSRRQFDDLALVDKLCDVLVESHMRPDLLTLEITETAILENRSRAGEVLQRLHDLGVNLSIDDFGVGYSSFLELRDFPISEVKIDRSFVKNVDTCDNSRKIIQAIVSVADAIGAIVVAEGIETRAQLEAIRSLGCHRAQGYFLCEPMSATTFPDVVLGGRVEKA